jgi:hypothetical protein
MNRFGKMVMPGVGLLAMLAVQSFSASGYAQAPASPAGPDLWLPVALAVLAQVVDPAAASACAGAAQPAMVAASHTLAPYFTVATAGAEAG